MAQKKPSPTVTTKPGFLLYKDFYDVVIDMTDEQAGILFKSIHQYQHDGTVLDVPLELRFLLKQLVSQFKRDNAKYKDICASRSVAGKKGAKQKLANAGKRKHKLANQADIDIDIDIEKDIDTETKKAFERVWNNFGRTGNKPTAFRYWNKLSAEEKQAVEKTIPAFVASRPDKKFRGHFSSWINPTNKNWKNEIHHSQQKSTKELFNAIK